MLSGPCDLLVFNLLIVLSFCSSDMFILQSSLSYGRCLKPGNGYSLSFSKTLAKNHLNNFEWSCLDTADFVPVVDLT